MNTAAHASRLAMHRSRKRVNIIALTLSLAAMAFGLFWLAWILVIAAQRNREESRRSTMAFRST